MKKYSNIKILVIADELGPTVSEFNKVMELLSVKVRYVSYRTVKHTEVRAKDIQEADSIIFIRSMSVLEKEIARIANKHGKYAVLLIDDDLLGLPDDYGVHHAGIWQGRKNSLKKMMDYIDSIVVGNELLAEKYLAIGKKKKKHIPIETIVEKDTLIKPSPKTDKSRILLYCNDGTTDMFEHILRPVLDLIAQNRPNEFELDLISLHPDLYAYENSISINYVPHMPYKEFREYINNRHYLIGLAPIGDLEFSKYKYCNKYIEFTRAGVAGVYSKCSIYERVIVNGMNGVLTSNETKDWYENIITLHENDKYRLQMVRNAQECILKNFSSEKITDLIISNLPELFEQHRDICEIKKSEMALAYYRHYCARFAERVYLLHRYFKVGGIKEVIYALKRRYIFNKEAKNE